MNKVADILAEARTVASSAETWADLSNAFFDPVDGLVSKAFPTRDERAAFVKTDTYKQIQRLIVAAQDRSGLLAGAVPTKSGRFVVRLPKTMHAALEREAESEGVSLNHLVVAKLAVQLDGLAGNPLGAVIQAFTEVREGNSADCVVADPELDRRFLERFPRTWRQWNGLRSEPHALSCPEEQEACTSSKAEAIHAAGFRRI